MLPGEGKEDRADALKETRGGSRGDLQRLRRTVAIGRRPLQPQPERRPLLSRGARFMPHAPSTSHDSRSLTLRTRGDPIAPTATDGHLSRGERGSRAPTPAPFVIFGAATLRPFTTSTP